MIPLINRLKKARHREVARAQDLVIEVLYKTFQRAVLHGGTAIWRCYGGNRFSEDIDVYLPKDAGRVELFFKSIEKEGFSIQKKKISENSIFSKLQFNNLIVRFEALFKKKRGFLKEYTVCDGTLITVYTLIVEELLNEKIVSYLKRLKIRDLYDIFFLLRHVKNKAEVKQKLAMLVKNFKQPIDKGELKVLIFEGVVPDVKQILDYIKRWV